MISRERSGSRLPVGSSANNRGGRATTARAMPTRCCSPPESVTGKAFLLAQQSHLVECRAYPAPDLLVSHARHDQRQGDVVEHGAVGKQPVVLEDHADLAAMLRNLASRQASEVASVDHDLAARGPL